MKVIEAKTFIQKLKGLMFQKDFNYILKFKTNGIHTFFMKKEQEHLQDILIIEKEIKYQEN